jgi:hypothetical protein
MLRIGHLVTVRIDDRGLPFNAEAEDELDADVIEQALLGGWIDGLTHESLGRDGNRTTLVRHVDPGPDLRDGADAATVAAAPAPVEEIADLGEVTGAWRCRRRGHLPAHVAHLRLLLPARRVLPA